MYKDVQKVVDTHTKIDDEEEAEELSWDEKRFALKQFLKNNRDILEPKLFQDDDDDEDEEEDELTDMGDESDRS